MNDHDYTLLESGCTFTMTVDAKEFRKGIKRCEASLKKLAGYQEVPFSLLKPNRHERRKAKSKGRHGNTR